MHVLMYHTYLKLPSHFFEMELGVFARLSAMPESQRSVFETEYIGCGHAPTCR
jgi:hypothetical protein